MLVRALAIVLCAGLLGQAGCKRTSKNDSEAESSSREAPPSDVSDGPTRIAICDRYLTRSLECLKRMPESMKSDARQRLERVRGDWTRRAARPAQREALTARCHKVYQAAVQTSGNYCPNVY